MKTQARAVWRIARVLVHAGHGLWRVSRGWQALEPASRARHVQWWSSKMLRVLGVSLQTHGRPLPAPCLMVANHISWLDILAIHAVCPQARFVAKADLRRWPAVGRLTAAAGTLFIERERKRDAMRVVHHMAEALQRGETVAVFPEGTTSDGQDVLPFHANLLQAAIATGVPVQPVAIRYADAVQAVSPAAAYVGDTSLLRSLWWVACAQGLVARVRLLPSHTVTDQRRALAQSLRSVIHAARDVR